MEEVTRPSRDFKLKASWGDKTFCQKENKKDAIYQLERAVLSKEAKTYLRVLTFLFLIGFHEYVHCS